MKLNDALTLLLISVGAMLALLTLAAVALSVLGQEATTLIAFGGFWVTIFTTVAGLIVARGRRDGNGGSDPPEG